MMYSTLGKGKNTESHQNLMFVLRIIFRALTRWQTQHIVEQAPKLPVGTRSCLAYPSSVVHPGDPVSRMTSEIKQRSCLFCGTVNDIPCIDKTAKRAGCRSTQAQKLPVKYKALLCLSRKLNNSRLVGFKSDVRGKIKEAIKN